MMINKQNIFKRLVGSALVFGVCISLTGGALAASNLKNNDVELVMTPISRPLTRSLTPTLKGGREVDTPLFSETLERVWGWSTLVDAAGGDVFHKTTAQYEKAVTGTVIGSQSEWGYAKVWAHSDWVSYNNVATVCYAKVYYDY
jgi:hypothetical protein